MKLFEKSPKVRQYIVRDFSDFMSLVLGYSDDNRLPRPAEEASRLRELGLEVIEKWSEKYGSKNGFKSIKLGHSYLKHTLKMQFPNLSSRREQLRKEEERKRANTQRILRTKFAQIQKQIDEKGQEIDVLLREMDNCFDILLPSADTWHEHLDAAEGIEVGSEFGSYHRDNSNKQSAPKGIFDDLLQPVEESEAKEEDQATEEGQGVFADVDVDELDLELPDEDEDDTGDGVFSTEGSSSVDWVDAPTTNTSVSMGEGGEMGSVFDSYSPDELDEMIRSHGLGSRSYTLEVKIPTKRAVGRNSENNDIFVVLEDGCKVVLKTLLPLVLDWVRTATRVDLGAQDAQRRSVLARLVGFKSRLEATVSKCNTLDVLPQEVRDRLRSRVVVDPAVSPPVGSESSQAVTSRVSYTSSSSHESSIERAKRKADSHPSVSALPSASSSVAKKVKSKGEGRSQLIKARRKAEQRLKLPF